MIKHHIIMSSAYTEGTRIALDITEDFALNSEALASALRKIKQVCGDDVPLSTHFITTESTSWESVAAYDPFFSGVKCVESADQFAAIVQKSRVLTGLDVATYILTKVRCTHLSLEKLAYFAYADYLCGNAGHLFEDQIYAFTHGPVVNSVYQAYRRSGARHIEAQNQAEDPVASTRIGELSSRSRILFARDGIEKLVSIDKTIEYYGKCSAGTLVGLTHRPGSPWSQVDHTKPYQIIPDTLIAKYHCVECI